MSNRTVMMFLANAYRPDIRVEKEAATLVDNDYSVTVVAWDRTIELPKEETKDNIQIRRIQNVQTNYGSGIRQIFYTPRFWREAIKIGIKYRPAIVHCHDLDTLYSGVQLKRLSGCRLIYDAHEDYPTLMTLYLPVFATRFLVHWERLLMRHADHIITASTVLADKYKAAGFSNLTVLPNVQDLRLFDNFTQEDIDSTKQKLNLEPEKLIVSYIGGFSRNRLLLPLIEAVSKLKDTELLLFGDGHQRQAVEQATRNTSNCHYFGWLPASDIPFYMQLSDVIYYCLRPDYPGAIFNAPNTLAYAMASGKPVIANNIGDLGRVVSLANCGVLLDVVETNSIQSAIGRLRDREFREKLGLNGRHYAEKEHNWAVVSHRLLKLYKSLEQ